MSCRNPRRAGEAGDAGLNDPRRAGDAGFDDSQLAGEAGFAMASALFAVFLLAVGAALLAASLELRVRVARDEARTVVRAALLDAALAEALAHLAASPAYPGTPAHPFGGGTLASEVQSLGSGRFRIVVHGAFRGRERSAAADVLRVERVEPGDAATGAPAEVSVDLRILAWRPLPRAAL